MKPEKPWGGRFAGPTSPEVERFTSSLPFDIRLIRHDIEGSLAHVEVLREAGCLSSEEAVSLSNGLRTILADHAAGRLSFDPSIEDVHMAVETALIERVGVLGGKLHTGRSRNDQVALDLRLWVRETAEDLAQRIDGLQKVLVAKAEAEVETVMPGFTHLQPAQPVSLAHYLLAFHDMFARDRDRFRRTGEACSFLPTGSGALAGVNFPLNRHRYAELLGFSKVTTNSMDAVSDRDFAVEFLTAGLLFMLHTSRLGEDLIFWASPLVGFVNLPEGFCTGSSIMPQKKNPDVLELIRGKTGRVLGNLVSLATVLKGLPMTYNRDLQEDKEPLFDTADTVQNTATLLTALIEGIVFNRETMAAQAGKGGTTATELADYLVSKGIPFREAHRVVGQLVRKCVDDGKNLVDLTPSDLREIHPLFGEDAVSRLIPKVSLEGKNLAGGTAPQQIRERIRSLKEGD